jgi:hypothetical protein
MSLLLTAVTTAKQETAIATLEAKTARVEAESAKAEAKEAKAEIEDLKYEVKEANIGVAEAKAEAEEAKEEAERAKEDAGNAKKVADEAKQNAKIAEGNHTVENNYLGPSGSRSPDFTCGSASFSTSFGTSIAGTLVLGFHSNCDCTIRLKIRVFSVAMSNGVHGLHESLLESYYPNQRVESNSRLAVGFIVRQGNAWPTDSNGNAIRKIQVTVLVQKKRELQFD